jgi:hypothetical protein
VPRRVEYSATDASVHIASKPARHAGRSADAIAVACACLCNSSGRWRDHSDSLLLYAAFNTSATHTSKEHEPDARRASIADTTGVRDDDDGPGSAILMDTTTTARGG